MSLLRHRSIEYIPLHVIQPTSPPHHIDFFCTDQEADRKILAALLEGEDADKNLEMARRERAIADAAWMKGVIEEQLQLERQREAEFDVLHR